MSDYQETLDYIFSSLPMFHRIGGAAYKANLDNTLHLSRLTGEPENNFPSVHIAGTNGKGSVSSILASVMQESGLRTALFTSPHLKDFRERIRINSKMIPKTDVVNFFKHYRKDFEAIHPSFFEMTFALAMWWFSREKPDIAIIETGMGGRLDSTNIIQPMLSVITNIGLDHQQFLGGSIHEIAGEKAGIIKQGTPVVIGETHKDSKDIFVEKARQMEAPVYFADRIYEVNSFRFKMSPSPVLDMNIWKEGIEYLPSLISPLAGLYQMRNAPTVLCSLDVLNDLGLTTSVEHIRQGYLRVTQNTGFRGRWQLIGRKPLIICDTGHNLDGIREVVRQIRLVPHEELHMVFGMVEDKERGEILDSLPRFARYYFCKPAVPRGLDAQKLLAEAETLGLAGQAFPGVGEALEAARSRAAEKDLIFVGGSTFVVAEVVK